MLFALLFSLLFVTQIEGKMVPQVRKLGNTTYECTSCVSLMTEAIDQLVNIIEDFGIAGGCEVLCSKLSTTLFSYSIHNLRLG